MHRFIAWYNTFMARPKGSKNLPKIEENKPVLSQKTDEITKVINPPVSFDTRIKVTNLSEDPQSLFNRLLKENNLRIDFDVIAEGTPVTTEFGIIKLEKPTLAVKATYVERE